VDHSAGIREFRSGDETAILSVMLRALERGELDGVNRHFVEVAANRIPQQPEGCAVAVDDGRLVGWIVPRDDDLTVDLPYRRRGHGSRLVKEGRRIARDLGLTALRLWVPRRDGSEAFARANGLRYRSSLWQMLLDPAADVDEPRFTDGFVARYLAPGTDDSALVDLINAAFIDHPWPFHVDPDEVRRVRAEDGFDPTSTLLVAAAADPDRPVGFCRTATYPDDDGTLIGEVKLVGVLREFRGLGLGGALVRWGIRAVRDRQARRVILVVEGENRGAIGLYQSLGFGHHVQWPYWTLPVAGADG
jgi:mycothiol synthase